MGSLAARPMRQVAIGAAARAQGAVSNANRASRWVWGGGAEGEGRETGTREHAASDMANTFANASYVGGVGWAVVWG